MPKISLNIIGHRKIFLSIAALLVLAALVSIFTFGFREGIDFKGGTLWTFQVAGGRPDSAGFQKFMQGVLGNNSEVRLNYDQANGSLLLRLPAETGSRHNELLTQIQAEYPQLKEQSFQSIGPSVGGELRQKSIIALALVLLGISLYIAYAFRKVFRPVSSWKYGFITLITLCHDVAIPAGLLAFLGHYGAVEIDSNFIIALLVIMGFSVHDTIVVFDRIRENLFLDRGQTDFSAVINRSVNETMARSVNTSLTLIFVLLAMYFAGPIALKYFVLTLLVGVTIGMYSSIFVASPLLLISHKTRGKA